MRISRQGESRFKLATSKAFYRLFQMVRETEMEIQEGDFRLISARVSENALKLSETGAFLRGAVPWLGFKHCALEYERDERLLGTSKYPVRKMVKLAVDGLCLFSTFPLRLILYLGFIMMLCSVCLLFWAFVSKLFGDPVSGWTLLFAAIVFFGGANSLFLGIIGEYMRLNLQAVQNRPKFIVAETTRV